MREGSGVVVWYIEHVIFAHLLMLSQSVCVLLCLCVFVLRMCVPASVCVCVCVHTSYGALGDRLLIVHMIREGTVSHTGLLFPQLCMLCACPDLRGCSLE